MVGKISSVGSLNANSSMVKNNKVNFGLNTYATRKLILGLDNMSFNLPRVKKQVNIIPDFPPVQQIVDVVSKVVSKPKK